MTTRNDVINELQRILQHYSAHYPQMVLDGKIAGPIATHRQECLVKAIEWIQPQIPATPFAKSVAELATPKQIVMMRAICRDLNIDIDLELYETMKLECKPEELSRRAASVFIQHLKDLQDDTEVPIVRRSY